MKRTALIVISMLALASLLFLAMQCDGGGGTTPVPTQPPQPSQPPASTAYPGPNPTSESPPYPGPDASPTPEAYPGGASGTPQGETLLQERCVQCHDLSRVTSVTKTAEEWRTSVTRMRDKGADLNDEEATILIEYLSTQYGK